MPSISTREVGDVYIVKLNDPKILDQSQIEQIGYELLQTVPKVTSNRMLLNLGTVAFMSSAMIGKIVQLNKKAKEAGIDLRICEITKGVMEVFNLMRLHKVLNIQKDEESAIASFDKKGWFG
ncbi:MAG TPA: STAS domain-containing protein [Pirellulaceae bacterium]|nr:STAS domain-containing protein [Pirellulaceae bacterium]